MSPEVYLVSGETRGIGLAMVKQLATREDTVVFSGARLDRSAATSLQKLQARYPDKIHILKLLSADTDDAGRAVSEIKKIAGRLDVVIANAAGLLTSYVSSTDVTLQATREHFEVNTLGPLALFQASCTLLLEADSPKFIVISSVLGSVQLGPAFPAGVLPYGASKAAVNSVASKLHHDCPGFGRLSSGVGN